MDLNYKEKLSFAESIEMIGEVCDTVFETNTETGRSIYLPELYDYAYRLAIARHYGGYTCSDIAEDNYNVAMDVDICSLPINHLQLLGIEEAILKKIDIRKSETEKSNISVVSKMDDLIEPIVDILSKLSDLFENIDIEKLNKKLNTLDMHHLVKAYLKSSFPNDKRSEIIDEKNNEIRNLKEKINQYTSVNVISDK